MTKPYVRRSDKVVEEIIERLATGESMREICTGDYMPNRLAVAQWCIKDEELRERIRDARRMGMEWHVDELIEIADDSGGDYEIETDKAGNQYVKVNKENVQRARVMIDTRKWVLSKMYSDLYGDKMNLTHTVDPLDSLTDEQLEQRLAALEKAGAGST